MSSMIANYSASSQDIWSRPSCKLQKSSADPSHTNCSEDSSENTWFTGGLPTPPGKIMNGLSVSSALPVFPANHSHPLQQPAPDSFPSHHRPSYSSQHNVDLSKHSRMNSMSGTMGLQPDKSASNLIATHLQIPESVNKSKGSLAEFAAEVCEPAFHQKIPC